MWYRKILDFSTTKFGSANPFTVEVQKCIDELQNNKGANTLSDIWNSVSTISDALNSPDPELYKFFKWYDLLTKENKEVPNVVAFRNLLINLQAAIQKIKENSEFSIDGKNTSELCQYTKLNTLKFLVKTGSEEDKTPGKLRLSNVVYLNDPSEGQVFIDLLNSHKSIQSTPTSLFNELFGRSIERDEQTLTQIHSYDVYISSFSTAKNKLPLWTLYGDNSNGCCMVFDKTFFTSSRKQIDPSQSNKYEQDLTLYKVHYCNKSFESINEDIKPLIENIADILLQLQKIIKLNVELFQWVVNNLEEIRFLFKSDDYQYENEVRLILRGGVTRPIVDRTTDVPKLYINIDKQVVFKEIILGAKVENPSAIAQFLLFAGIKNVTLSGITFR